MPKKATSKPSAKEATQPAPKTLLPEQILALTRITSSKLVSGARGQLKAGATYDVDFGVRVTGQVIVGHEADFTCNNVPKVSDLVQVLLAQFGPRKRQQIVNEVISAGIQRIIAPDDTAVDGLADLAEKLIDGLTTTTKGTRRGNVTGDCAVSVVEWK